MSCVILRDVEGNERRVPMGEPYTRKPGEERVGVDKKCFAFKALQPAVNVTSERKQLLAEMEQVIGPGMGDWIKKVAGPIAKVIGKSNCSSCETRKVVTNAYSKLKAKHGQIEALAKIKELWVLSFQKEDEVVLEKLKGYLE